MGETRVDLLHLLEDLRDAYPGSVEETILTEIVANSLDSGARRIRVWADPASATLTVVDDGEGMSRQSLTRYHDLAATGKRRGRSIGFAGVGIKLGLLVSAEVVTEARRVRTHLATSWRLASRSRAPWRWVEPAGLLERAGTAVRLYLSNALSPLLEPGRVEEILLRHFQPLLDPGLDSMLAGFYPHGVAFEVNGRALPRSAPGPGRVKVTVRLGRQRKPTGMGYLVRDTSLAEGETGIAVSTLGKVIERGWDWLGLAPVPGAAVGGLIEVPALAEALTLNKADFIRTGTRGATFLAYRKAIQEVVGGQLADWGTDPKGEPIRQRRTRPLERDLQGVLLDLSREFPLLATLVERQAGGQKGLPFGGLRVAARTGAQGLESETPEGSAPPAIPARFPAVAPTTGRSRATPTGPGHSMGARWGKGRSRRSPVPPRPGPYVPQPWKRSPFPGDAGPGSRATTACASVSKNVPTIRSWGGSSSPRCG